MMQIVQRTNQQTQQVHTRCMAPPSSTPLPTNRKRHPRKCSVTKSKPRRDSEELMFDEEKQKAHRYWMEWGTNKAIEILKDDIDKQAIPTTQIMFSAHCGGRKRYRRCRDDVSEVTDISMLACSDTVTPSNVTPFLPSVNRAQTTTSGNSRDSNGNGTQGSTRKLRWNPTLVSTSPRDTPNNVCNSLAYRITAKLATTLQTLQHVTGYGDNTDVIVATEQDAKRYTGVDFARTARYPQEIRLSPSLSKLIAVNVLSRMGRKKSRQITSKDVKLFEDSLQTSIMKEKKVCIASWLNELDLDFSPITPPEIVELEPKLARESSYPIIGSSRMIDLCIPSPETTSP